VSYGWQAAFIQGGFKWSGSGSWPWLLPACVPRLVPGGFVYAEAGRIIEPPPPLLSYRSDKAGQVHYHLFALPGLAD